MLPTDDGTTGFGVTQGVRHHWLARNTSRHDRNACYDLIETAAFWHSLATKRVRPPGVIRFGVACLLFTALPDLPLQPV